MVEQNRNLYTDSRDDIAEMYGRPNDRGDYGVRGPLRTTVEVEPVESPDPAAGPEQLDLFSSLTEVPVTVAKTTPVRVRARDEAVPMPPEIRQQIRDMQERAGNAPRLGGRSREQADQDFYDAHWREQNRNANRSNRK